MGKESQIHKAIREYWKESKRKQRERDAALQEQYNKELPDEPFREFKEKQKKSITF